MADGFGTLRRKLGELPDLDWSSAGRDVAPDVRRDARLIWEARMRDEARAVVAMSALLTDLARAGASLDVLGAATKVVHDEAEHVALCGRLAHAFQPDHSVDDAWPVVPPHKTRDLRRRITVSVVSLLCVGETLSTVMLRDARAACLDATTADALEILLRDESIHGRFGWWWLETPEGALREEEVPIVESMLARLFARLERSVTRGDDGGALVPGALPPGGRRAAFVRAATEVVVPRFERLGIGARTAWESRADDAAMEGRR